jgi:hypothetical protein
MVGNIAFCGSCGKRIALKGHGLYRCCIRVPAAALDELVFEAIVAWVADTDTFRQLRHATDRDLNTAQADIDRLTASLDQWRLSAARGQTTPESLMVIEADISRQLRDAQQRAERASVPPVVRDLLGDTHGGSVEEADVRRRLADAPLGAQRDLVRALMTITVHGVRQRGTKITDRVDITWR